MIQVGAAGSMNWVRVKLAGVCPREGLPASAMIPLGLRRSGQRWSILSRDTIERAMRTLTRYELGATVVEERRT